MKIGVNTRVLISNRMEGVARYIFETVRRMAINNPHDEFHLFFDRPYSEEFVFSENVIPHVIGFPTRHPILWYLWFEYFLPRALKKNKIDVLYSGDTFLSLTAKVTTVLVSHDINYFHFPEHVQKSHLYYYKKFFPKYHRKADRIIAVSQATASDIESAYQLDEAKIEVAYNDVPEGFKFLSSQEKIEQRNIITQGIPYFMYLGSLHPRKNVENLIKAFEIFKSKTESNYKLVLFGRLAWKTEKLMTLYRNSEYKDDILFRQNEDANVFKSLAAAEALCYVSLLEGFGIPILEAFHSGTPVITSNRSSMPEVAGNAALLVDPDSPESISEAMLKIESQPGLRDDLIKRGLDRKEEFNWDESSKVIYRAIQDCGLST